LFGDRVVDIATARHELAVSNFVDGAAFRDYFKTNYGPTIAAYRGIADQPDRVDALDADIALLGDDALAGARTMQWEYLMVVARKA
jgi:hypothetical protein